MSPRRWDDYGYVVPSPDGPEWAKITLLAIVAAALAFTGGWALGYDRGEGWTNRQHQVAECAWSTEAAKAEDDQCVTWLLPTGQIVIGPASMKP